MRGIAPIRNNTQFAIIVENRQIGDVVDPQNVVGKTNNIVVRCRGIGLEGIRRELPFAVAARMNQPVCVGVCVY